MIATAHSLQQLNTRPRSERAVTPPPAPAEVHRHGIMSDSHGRTIRDLRISITDRCNFRCVYCMDPDVQFAPRSELLTRHEIIRLARIAEALGVRKIRLTGGEPTVHPELLEIISGIRRATSVELAMITNGSLLTRERLRAWKGAGLDRITVSLDSLRPDRFAMLTRAAGSPATVLAGIEAAIAEGVTPLKVNAVLMRGVNDDEAADLASLARVYGVEVRFIEYMPLDSARAWDDAKWVSASQTRAQIERVFPLVSAPSEDRSSTARLFEFADGRAGRIGFISSVSDPFCGACSRLRLTADGKIRPCLFSSAEWDVLSVLRCGAGDDELRAFFIDASWTKQAGHGMHSDEFHQPARSMSAIGG